MSLKQYHQYEHQNALFDLSTGSIHDFDCFNVHSRRQQEEFDDAKVIITYVFCNFIR